MSQTITAPVTWKPSSFGGLGPSTEVQGFGYRHGDRYQTVFNPHTSDFYAAPSNPTNAHDRRSSTAPSHPCTKLVDVISGKERVACKTCFDISNGKGPTVPCTFSKPQKFEPIGLIQKFITALTLPPEKKRTDEEINKRLKKAYSLLHPGMQMAWGRPSDFQRKMFDPRSPFGAFTRAKQVAIESVQLEPNDAKGQVNIRIFDRLATIHSFTVYLERNTIFDTFSFEFSNLEWKIRHILPQVPLT